MYKGIEIGTEKIIYGNYIMPEDWVNNPYNEKTYWIGIGDEYNVEWRLVKPNSISEVAKYENL